MSKKSSQEKTDWNMFVSSRAAQLEGELFVLEKEDPDYKELSEASDALYEKINAALSDDLQLALSDYSNMRTGMACTYVDTAYELGMKDAFMLMKKFIL